MIRTREVLFLQELFGGPLRAGTQGSNVPQSTCTENRGGSSVLVVGRTSPRSSSTHSRGAADACAPTNLSLIHI